MFFGKITSRQSVIKKNKKTALEKVVLKVTQNPSMSISYDSCSKNYGNLFQNTHLSQLSYVAYCDKF